MASSREHDSGFALWDPRVLVTADARSLALFRIVAGLLLLHDHVWRLVDAPLLLSNVGVLTDHFSLFVDETWPRTSLLFGLGEPWQVRVFIVAACVLDVGVIVGIRTRTTATLALISAISIAARNPLIYYGGDLILHTLLAWGLLLPLGDRFSVDAWLARQRGEALGPPRHVSLAVLGPTIELFLVYFFNGYLKVGATWTEGSAIHYTLWMDCLVRPSGVWLRTHASTSVLWFLAWSTRVVEEVGAFLLLSPLRPGWSRLIALTPLFLLHVAILSTTAIANFALIMIGSYTLLITAGGWSWIASAARSAGLRRLADIITEAGEELPAVIPTSPRDAETERTGWSLSSFDWRRVAVGLRELAAAAFLFATLSSAYTFSPLAPESLRFQAPRWTFALNGPLHNRHVWGLFAPDAPMEDGLLVIEGETRDGRAIDPLTGEAPRTAIRPGEEVDSNTRFFQWTRYVRLGEWRRYRPDITRFVWTSHLLPGRNPADEIVSFRVVNLHRQSPPLGSQTPGPTKRDVLWEEARPR